MSKTTVEECQKIAISKLKIQTHEAMSVEINNQAVALTQTVCRFGGWRYWFQCPSCSNRIGVLYRKPLGVFFLCRHCQNLTYQLTKYRRSRQEVFMKTVHKIKANSLQQL